nr:CHASE4 domain-containing protein [Chroococcidiopsis cubana]
MGEIVYGKFSEPTCQKCLPVGSDLQQHLASKELLRGDNAIAGLILLQRTPILIAVRPIRKTDRSKLSHGVLILGRYLNRDAIAAYPNALISILLYRQLMTIAYLPISKQQGLLYCSSKFWCVLSTKKLLLDIL